jgi:hypothetical protein
MYATLGAVTRKISGAPAMSMNDLIEGIHRIPAMSGEVVKWREKSGAERQKKPTAETAARGRPE